MAANIGVKIGIEGAAQFKQSLTSVNTELRALSSEMKAATAQFKGNENSQEALSKKADILSRTMDAAKQKVELLTAEYDKQQSRLKELANNLEEAKKQYGENSEEVRTAEKALSQQEVTVGKLATQLHNAEASLYETQNAERELGTTAEDTTEKTSTFGDMLRAKLTGDAIVGAVKTLANGIKDLGVSIWNTAKETGEYADKVQTLATQYNLTTDQVQEFMYMEDLADVSMETIAGSLTKLTRNMGEAQSGTGAAAEAFAKLGVEVTNSDGTLRNANDVFLEAVDALGHVENATERDTIAMDLFGKSAQDLNPLIALGADGFNDLAAEAHNAGAVMSGEALTAANGFQDSLERARQKADGLKRQLGEKLAPAFEAVIDKAIEWADGIDWDRVGAVIQGVFNGIATAINAVKAALDWVKRAADLTRKALETLGTTMGPLASTMPGPGPVSPTKTGPNFATGYYNVPYDNYPAYLHAGEMVLTAAEASALRNGGMGGATVNIYTQQLDEATVDYVVARVNGALGGAL